MDITFEKLYNRKANLIAIEVYLAKDKDSDGVLLKNEFFPSESEINELQLFADQVAEVVGSEVRHVSAVVKRD